jgi:hypothetical protein
MLRNCMKLRRPHFNKSSTKPKFYLFFSMALPAHSGPWPLIKSRNHFSQTVVLLGRVISPSQGNYLNTGQHTHRINEYTHQTFIPWVGFEPTISASERGKTVHALDCAATLTGHILNFSPLKPSGYDTHHLFQHTKSKLCLLPTEYIWVFHMVVTINSDCFAKHWGGKTYLSKVTFDP